MAVPQNYHLLTFTLIAFITATSVIPANSYKIANEHDAMMYLNRFGYVDDEQMTRGMSMSSMKPMLMEFQKMCHISQTGVLDRKTVEMMNTPRCGNLDVDVTRTDHHLMYMRELERVGHGVTVRRNRRYAINDRRLKWKKRELTYKIAIFSKQMGSHVTEKQTLEEVHRAFKLWSQVTNLDFIHSPKRKEVDIELSFTTKFHIQDNSPFDGPGMVLAHAFSPGEGVYGDVHYDDEEPWTTGTPKGINLLQVTVHEIGHALGLNHSDVKGAIMQPIYRYSANFRLHKDDIEGVQSLYGKRETRPDLCKDSSIDAITMLADGSIYAFKGEYTYLIDSKGKGILPGWPRRIEDVFKGLEGNLDAAVTRRTGETYFFKGQNYWKFRGTQPDSGYPRHMSTHFKGIPDNVDSAFECTGVLYFTKGDKLWGFYSSSKPYPISLSVLRLGRELKRIDASLTARNGNIYFFSGDLYWRYNRWQSKVNNDSPPYPRSSRVMWFGCTGGAPPNYREIRQNSYGDQDDSDSLSYSLFTPDNLGYQDY